MSRAEPEKAIGFFQKALAGRPDDPLIGLSLGRALIASNKPESLTQAVSVLEKVLEKEPNWAFVKRQLAIAYGRTGQLHLADILLAEEALLKGDTQRAITLASRLAKTPDMDKAVHTRALDILFELNVPLPVQ